MAERSKSLFEAHQELIAAEHEYYVAQRAFETAVPGGDQREISRAGRAVSVAVARFASAKRQCGDMASVNSHIEPDGHEGG